MSAAFALILLAQAATPCPSAAPVPLPGGATIVRPVGKVEPLPFEQLGPATGLSKPEAVDHTGAASGGEQPAGDAEPLATCAVAAVDII